MISAAVLYYYHKELENKMRSLFIEQAGTWKATLYFGDERSDFLIPEFRTITTSGDPTEKASALVNELILGPTARGMRTLPRQTKLLGTKTGDDGLLSINFGPELIQYHPGGSTAELITVYSIVDTVTVNIPEVNKVQLLINGSQVESIAGHIDCSKPFYQRRELVH